MGSQRDSRVRIAHVNCPRGKALIQLRLNNSGVGMSKKLQFELLDHCCRVCGGRLLQRGAGESVQIRCAECGAIAEVAAGQRQPYTALCFCGQRLANGADAGLRCKRSDHRSPERPQELVVHQEPVKAGMRARPAARPIRVGFDVD